MLGLSVSTLRNHVPMLAKEQHVLNRIRFSCGDNALLQRVRFRVADQPQVNSKTVFPHCTKFSLCRRSELRHYKEVYVGQALVRRESSE